MAERPALKPEVNDWQPVQASDWQDVNAGGASEQPHGWGLSSIMAGTTPLHKAFDKATTVTPEQEQGHSPLVNRLQEFGAGAIQGAGQPFVHPIETVKGIAKFAANPLLETGQMGADAVQHPAQALGNLAGGAALGEGIGAAATSPWAGALAEKIPSIPTRAKAGTIFNNLGTKLADSPVTLTNSTPQLTQLEKIGATGPAVPTTVGKLLDRSRMIEPMNYPEARLFQENLSNPSVLEKQSMAGSMKGGIKQLKPAFYNDIRDTAETQGLGNDYDKAMTMYRRAAMMNDMAKGVGKHVGKMAGTAALGGAGYGLYKAFQGDK